VSGAGRILAAVALAGLAGCAGIRAERGPQVEDLAGAWRGRWFGPAGHAVAALTVEPDGAYRMTMYLDGGDRPAAGTLMTLPSGRIRYQGADGNGWLGLEDGRLHFRPDGGGGGGLFERVRP
jgi:hypothetical protein